MQTAKVRISDVRLRLAVLGGAPCNAPLFFLKEGALAFSLVHTVQLVFGTIHPSMPVSLLTLMRLCISTLVCVCRQNIQGVDGLLAKDGQSRGCAGNIQRLFRSVDAGGSAHYHITRHVGVLANSQRFARYMKTFLNYAI